MRRLLLPATLALTCACVHGRSQVSTPAPILEPASVRVRTPEVGLPFHRAAIVELAMLPPQPGQRWRLASVDAEGWLRIWADGRLVSVAQPHRGGIAALRLADDGAMFTAGFDGRVIEWRDDTRSGGPFPVRAWDLLLESPTGRRPAPVTAMAVTDQRLAISDGHWVQLWSRPVGDETSELLWSMPADHFVTGLTMSSGGGGVVAAAELRVKAMREGRATHPLAVFPSVGLAAVEPEREVMLRALANRDYPGATADLIEVWQPSRHRHRILQPQQPIDA
ncbi:MAG: hypothetical protein KC431_00565, partial [Myxococcales bacterium]|nr:hypothetical protein [Myxococcales bacterium]